MIIWLLWILAVYLALGAAFAVPFAIRGVAVIDPVAKSSTLAFRIIIIPGAAALWPLLLAKWIKAREVAPNFDRPFSMLPLIRLHRAAWPILAILTAAVIILALINRPPPPPAINPAPVQAESAP